MRQTRVHGQFFRLSFLARTAILLIVFVSSLNESKAQPNDTTFFGWTERKLTAVALSTIIPGSGQTYLGHSTKGAILTVGAFGCGLITLLSEHNVVGRNERLEELETLYNQSTNWTYSNAVWNAMLTTKDLQNKDTKRRDAFMVLTAAFWVASVVDIVVFSDDLGENTFGAGKGPGNVNLAISRGPNSSVQTTLTLRF